MGWGSKRGGSYSVCSNPKCQRWAWDDKGFSVCKKCGSAWAGGQVAKKVTTVWDTASITLKGAKGSKGPGNI